MLCIKSFTIGPRRHDTERERHCRYPKPVACWSDRHLFLARERLGLPRSSFHLTTIQHTAVRLFFLRLAFLFLHFSLLSVF